MGTISAVFEAPGRVVLKEFNIPRIGPNEAILKVERAGICSTDVGMYQGKIRAGDFPSLPIIPGHEIVGIIEEIGSEASKRMKVTRGDRVIVDGSISCGHCRYCMTGSFRFCPSRLNYGVTSCERPPHLWGAYSQHMYLAPHTVVHKISRDVTPEAAVLAFAVIANGIQWVQRLGGASIGDTVAILGIGSQGLAATIAAREAGVSTIIVVGLHLDKETQRFALAKEFGAHFTIDSEEDEVVQAVSDITKGEMADIVVDVTGSPSALAKALDLVRPQGTVLCAGLVGTETITPLLTDKIVWKEIRFQGAFSKGVEATTAAIRLIESKRIPLEKMVTHQFPLSDVHKALEIAASRSPEVYPIKVALIP